MEILSSGGVFMKNKIVLSASGVAAGLVNGLLGAGGGMVLVPLLRRYSSLSESEQFPASIAIMAPICIISLFFSAQWQLSTAEVLPYLLGSAIGGTAAGRWGRFIPTKWLHRFLGFIILWGGIRYLW